LTLLLKSSIAVAHIAANLTGHVTRLCLLERKGNLVFRKSALFHGTRPFQYVKNHT
jgi:hypothetical protein